MKVFLSVWIEQLSFVIDNSMHFPVVLYVSRDARHAPYWSQTPTIQIASTKSSSQLADMHNQADPIYSYHDL